MRNNIMKYYDKRYVVKSCSLWFLTQTTLRIISRNYKNEHIQQQNVLKSKVGLYIL